MPMTTSSDGKAPKQYTPMEREIHLEATVAPIEDRDDDDPEFVIDPMLSGTQDDGGEHRELRHRTAEPSLRSSADLAVENPEAIYDL